MGEAVSVECQVKRSWSHQGQVKFLLLIDGRKVDFKLVSFPKDGSQTAKTQFTFIAQNEMQGKNSVSIVEVPGIERMETYHCDASPMSLLDASCHLFKRVRLSVGMKGKSQKTER